MTEKLSTVDLALLIRQLAASYPNLSQASLFGSRRFKTRSPRSDIDLLLFFSGEAPASTELAERAREVSVYLDLFIAHDEKTAESAINGSRISALDAESDIAELLNAETIWSQAEGFVGSTFRIQRVLREFVPWYTVAELQGNPAGRRSPIDYLVITALDDEFRAAERVLAPYLVGSDPALGMLGRQVVANIPHPPDPGHDEQVILCQSDRMGNLASGLTTAEALTRWAPRLVILIGITAGISGRVREGDIVVADRIYDYEAAKLNGFKIEPHGHKFLPSPSARQRLASWEGLEEALKNSQPVGGPLGPPRLISAGYASGEKVVASRRVVRRIARQDRKIAAIEMESLGVADACRREGIEHMVIKAVTDLADKRKSDDYRSYCCELVSRLLVQILRQRVFVR